MSNKSRFTLVLGGGAAKGLAHIGVLEVLKENDIPIRRIIGTSMGALIAAAFVSGKLEETKGFFLSMSPWRLIRMFFKFPSRKSIFNTKYIDAKLKRIFQDYKFEDLKIPVVAVAYNLTKKKIAVFDKGSIADAVRASISSPGYFEAHEINGDIFIDGSVEDNLPISQAKRYYTKYSKANIIAVDVESKSPKNKSIIVKSFRNLLYASKGMNTSSKIIDKNADLTIYPIVKAQNFQYYKAKESIEEGRRAALEALPRIMKMIH